MSKTSKRWDFNSLKGTYRGSTHYCTRKMFLGRRWLDKMPLQHKERVEKMETLYKCTWNPAFICAIWGVIEDLRSFNKMVEVLFVKIEWILGFYSILGSVLVTSWLAATCLQQLHILVSKHLLTTWCQTRTNCEEPFTSSTIMADDECFYALCQTKTKGSDCSRGKSKLGLVISR